MAEARVAIARKLVTLVYYGLRDGEIRCLAEAAERLGATGCELELRHGPTAGRFVLEPNRLWPDRSMSPSGRDEGVTGPELGEAPATNGPCCDNPCGQEGLAPSTSSLIDDR